MDIFDDIGDAIQSFLSLFRPVWGTYEEPGYRKYPPYTAYNKNLDISAVRQQIKDNISANTQYGQFCKATYQSIYTNAQNSVMGPLCHENNNQVCEKVFIAKNAAFIYMMGFSPNGLPLDNDATYNSNYFYTQAVNAIFSIGFSIPHYNFYEKDFQFWRAKELLMLLQAHEYLLIAQGSGSPYNDHDDVREYLFDYTYELYSEGNNFTGGLLQYNNIGLNVAAAVGTAAIILHDRGTYLWNIESKPERWANAAHSYIQRTMFNGPGINFSDAPGPMTDFTGNAGYAEGPHYFAFAFESLMPFFVAYNNFLDDKDHTGTYYTSMLNFFGNDVSNYLKNGSYDNLYKWYCEIGQSNGNNPSYDDSYINTRLEGSMSILQKSKYNPLTSNDYSRIQLKPIAVNLEPDFLTSFNPPQKYEQQDIYGNKRSGNLIVRSSNETPIEDKQSIHVLAERETALNGYRPFDWGHEHGDVTSYIITAGEDVLAMDPPYYSWASRDNINKGNMHNLITIDGEGPDPEDQSIYCDINNDKEITVKASYWNYFLGYQTSPKATVTRKIEVHQETNPPYYVINDYVKNENWLQAEFVQFNLNGNGNENEGTFEIENGYDNVAKWSHPCKKDDYPDDNWKMRASLTTYINGTPVSKVIDRNSSSSHGNDGEILNPISKEINSITYTNKFVETPVNYKGNLTKLDGGTGNHTRMYKQLSILAGEEAHFKTTIQMLRCPDETTLPPLMVMNTRYTSHLLSFQSPENFYNLHFSRNQQTPVTDTSINPFGINSSAVLSTDAQNIFLSYSTDREFKTGNCYTFTNFRKARIETGRELSYNDTTYIFSSKFASAYYSLEGKYKYKGYVQTDTACDLKLYLADVDTNFAMAAVGISYNYNDTTHIMTLHAPVGNTNFTVELADPCLMSCFFPYTTDSIKNTFDFATGTKETLPHKLTITTPNGYLKIRNGSHMQICSGKWLRNKDSLIVDYRCPEDGDQGKGLVVCPDVVNRLHLTNPPPTISQLYPSTDDYTPSQITVNSYAALILDSGSYTRFGNNTKLNIKPYASLIIRKNAKLDIGDAKSCGHAEIICEPNSYVHFEDSADIKFWQMKDTNDVHLFYISLKPQATAAHAGIEPAMLDMLLNTDNIIDTSIAHAEPICDVAKIRADYGVNNRDWGFGNFIKPKAWAYMANDTLCPDECLYVNYDRMLNDVRRGITICQIDTVYNPPYLNIIYTGCYSPAIPGGNMGMTISSGDGCDSIKNSKPISFCDLNAQIPGKWYRIFLSSYNDCDQLDTMKLYFIRMPRLLPDFTMADTGCAGIGSVSADENNDWNSRHFRDITKWHVHVIDSAAPNYLLQSVQYGGDWEYAKGAYPGTFTFPNFNWIGGFRYAVSHTIGTRGCKDTTMWDTIMIVPGAHITASIAKVYAEPIAGATSVKLQGYIRAADSFTWTPDYGLNRTDTLSIISTPHESISYILSAYKGTCVARDTISIRYNELSNIGTNDTLCYNNNIIALGNHYNAAMFLGWLQYNDVIDVNTELRNIIANLNNDDIYFDRYLKYFDSYMLAGRFKESQDTNCFAYYDLFKNSETYNWDMIFKDSLFVTYYNNYLHYIEGELLDTSIASTKINRFKTFIRDAGFKTIIEKYPIDSTKLRCFKYLFANYESYLRGIYDESYYPLNVNWSKIEGQDTSSMDWENDYIAIVNPTKTTTYIQQALFPYGDISIDSKTIFIDTALAPLFYPTIQWDSSAYFTNGTSPLSSTNNYLWNFGDGSATSTDVNPFHTFPAFDSNYVVCLTATNRCGSYTYCDTVWIDSMHIGGSFKVVAVRHSERSEESKEASEHSKTNASNNHQPTTNNCQLSNYPNPFDQSTIIDYEIWQTYSKAELRISNVLGQEVYIQRLNRPMDKVQIDGSALHDGLYYYSLVVDGVVKLTKTMSVIR